jgi:GNAT superfamily N-acetyltransferase
MASQLVVRLATSAEHEQLEALQRRASLAWDAYRADLLAHPEAIELPIEQIKGCRVLVAERDGKILGFVSVLAPGRGTAELDGLFVEPEQWRCGVGSQLVEAAANLAFNEGAMFIHAIVGPEARGFYESRGFELLGDEPTRFGKGFSMRMRLSPR